MTNRSDAFTRANSTTTLGSPTDGGSAWVAQAGTWGIVSNTGYKEAAAATFQTAVLESSVTAVDVQVTLQTLGTNKLAGVIARSADDNNHILAYFDGVNGQMYLYKRVASSYTLLANPTGLTIVAGDFIRLRTDSSDLLGLYQNSVFRASATDSAGSANTKHGLIAYDAAGGAANFNDFAITAVGVSGSLASDDFNRTDGALGPNWVTLSGLAAMAIASNQAGPGTAANCAAFWQGILTGNGQWPNDQFSEVVLGTTFTESDNGGGAMVRAAVGAQTAYFCQASASDARIYRVVAGVYAQLGTTDTGAVVAGDAIRLTAVGTTITCTKNGVTIIGPVTDSNIASGNAGIRGSSANIGQGAVDSWKGGDATSTNDKALSLLTLGPGIYQPPMGGLF